MPLEGRASYVQYVLETLGGVEVKKLLGVTREKLMELIELYVDHRKQHTLGQPHKLSPAEEMLLILTFLRHHLVDVLMGALFNIHQNLVGAVRKRMLHFLYDNLREELSMETREFRVAAAGGCRIFRSTFTVILDGSEQPVTASGDEVLNNRFYSKKRNNTASMLCSS